MSLSKEFEDLCDELRLTEDENGKWNKRIKEITKKLNIKYYDTTSTTENLTVVGSVGRGTAIHNVSDFDILFEMPQEKYKQFDNHSGNGQSALLQEIKNEIQDRYSSTKIKGDGQVVVVSFKDGDIEIVPGFRQIDDTFKHPDSHNDGSWKITKPLPEINAVSKLSSETDYHYIHLCRLLRTWKNHVGFKFKGLLIDTMVKNFMNNNEARKSIGFSDYYTNMIDLFKYLSQQDAEATYWLAIGSKQQISNSDSGAFIKKAKKAYNKLKDINEDSEDSILKMQELLGNKFAKNTDKVSNSMINIADTEELVEDKFTIDIRYNLKINCNVTQNGFRTQKLTNFISKRLKLKAKKDLTFFIQDYDIPSTLLPNVTWYWKVRNIGIEAVKQSCERGQIFKGTDTQHESTSFSGKHYVECYAVVENTVIARSKLIVPIDTLHGADFA